MPARYTLHGIWLSGPTYKVGLMLALCGEPFDYVHVDLRAGEHKQPGFLARQRYGQVPLLVDGSNDRRLVQSGAILEYLADVTGRLGGATLDERIRAREWMYWDFDRLAVPVYRSRAARLGIRQLTPGVPEMYAQEGDAALRVLDGHLAGRSWVVGEGATVADVDLYGVAAYGAQGGFAMEGYPNVAAWMRNVEALPGFSGPDALLPKASRPAP